MKTAFCFDLDGTLTKDEILPIIAKNTDFSEEIRVLTTATLQGHLNFRQSFLLRCHILKDVPIQKVHEDLEKVELFSGILHFVNSYPDQCFIVTGNLDIWIRPIMDKVNCRFFTSSATLKDGALHKIFHVMEKEKVVQDLAKSKQFSRIVSVGDGVADVNMFNHSDLSIAFGGVHQPVRTVMETADMVAFDEGALCQELSMLL